MKKVELKEEWVEKQVGCYIEEDDYEEEEDEYEEEDDYEESCGRGKRGVGGGAFSSWGDYYSWIEGDGFFR